MARPQRRAHALRTATLKFPDRPAETGNHLICSAADLEDGTCDPTLLKLIPIAAGVPSDATTILSSHDGNRRGQGRGHDRLGLHRTHRRQKSLVMTSHVGTGWLCFARPARAASYAHAKRRAQNVGDSRRRLDRTIGLHRRSRVAFGQVGAKTLTSFRQFPSTAHGPVQESVFRGGDLPSGHGPCSTQAGGSPPRGPAPLWHGGRGPTWDAPSASSKGLSTALFHSALRCEASLRQRSYWLAWPSHRRLPAQ